MPNKGSKGEYAPLPSTLERSPKKAQDTYEKTLEHAEEEYAHDEERAHRVAWSAVKHSYEKVGDHWEAKKQRGPSDPRAAQGGPDASGPSYGGVDVEGKTKAELIDEAEKLGAHIPAGMTKAEIADTIHKANKRATAKARKKPSD